jgi:hypothetical protein
VGLVAVEGDVDPADAQQGAAESVESARLGAVVAMDGAGGEVAVGVATAFGRRGRRGKEGRPISGHGGGENGARHPGVYYSMSD